MFNPENTTAQAKYPLYLGLTGTTLNAWLTVACTTAMALFGYDQGVFAGIIVTHDFLRAMGNPSPTLLATIVSLFNLGSFFGALFAFSYGSKLGRRKALLIGMVIMSIGAILQFSAFSVSQMTVARIITGLGNGISTATAPVWQSETSKPRWRSRLVVLGTMQLGGVWFQLYTRQYIVEVFHCLSTAFLRYWLLEQGRQDEAIRVLMSLEGPKATPQDDGVVNRVEVILEVIRVEKETSPTWKSFLRGKTNGNDTIKRLALGVGIQWMQQLVGINAKNYYLPLVLQHSVNMSNNLARLVAACNSVSYLLFSLFGLLLVERAGRRKFLILGAMGQCICYILIPGFLSQSNNPREGFELGGAISVFFFLYYAFFAMCWQGIPWLYPSEINKPSMQSKGAALGTATNWHVTDILIESLADQSAFRLFNYLIVQLTPIGIANLGWRFYMISAIVNAIFVPLVWLFYPETANRKSEDIDQLYRENTSMVFVFKMNEAIQINRPERFMEAERDRQRIEKATTPASVELSNTTDTTLVV